MPTRKGMWQPQRTSNASSNAWIAAIPLPEVFNHFFHPRFTEPELANYGTEEWNLRALLRAPHCCAPPTSHAAQVAVLPVRFTRVWQDSKPRKAEGMLNLASLYGEAAGAIRRFHAERAALALPRLQVLIAASNTNALDYLGSERESRRRGGASASSFAQGS